MPCFRQGFIAQLVEHCTSIVEVVGSNPIGDSEFFWALFCICLSYFTTVKISFTSILYIRSSLIWSLSYTLHVIKQRASHGNFQLLTTNHLMTLNCPIQTTPTSQVEIPSSDDSSLDSVKMTYGPGSWNVSDQQQLDFLKTITLTQMITLDKQCYLFIHID